MRGVSHFNTHGELLSQWPQARQGSAHPQTKVPAMQQHSSHNFLARPLRLISRAWHWPVKKPSKVRGSFLELTPEQQKQVEDIVNEQINKDLKVSFKEYPTKVAIEEKGALGQFGDRYGETVKVYEMIADGAEKPFSFEICGGPHIDHTLQLI